MTTARMSIGVVDQGRYNCTHEWPADCFVQCGDSGIVITDHGTYRTAFFEAFPRNPNTFIRGEGKTVVEAEEKCWSLLQKYSQCDHPSFEPRDYENGSGYCTVCGLWFSRVIPAFHPCFICGEMTWHSKDNVGDWWCGVHYKQIPEDRMTDVQKSIRRMTEEDEHGA